MKAAFAGSKDSSSRGGSQVDLSVSAKIGEKIGASIENLMKAAERDGQPKEHLKEQRPKEVRVIADLKGEVSGVSGSVPSLNRNGSMNRGTLDRNDSSAKFKFGAASGNASNRCVSCGKTAYPVEQLRVDDIVFHKQCFKCEHCHNKLSLGKFASLEGKVHLIWCSYARSTIVNLILNNCLH